MPSSNVRMYSLYKDIYPQKEFKQELLVLQKKRDQQLFTELSKHNAICFPTDVDTFTALYTVFENVTKGKDNLCLLFIVNENVLIVFDGGVVKEFDTIDSVYKYIYAEHNFKNIINLTVKAV